MKQMGLAVTQYAQDNDERMPLNTTYAGCTTTGAKSWRTFLYPYTKSTQVFVCPSNIRNKTNTARDQDDVVGRIKLSYAVNLNAIYGATNGSLTDCSYRPIKNGVEQLPLMLSQIANSSEFIVISESVDVNDEVVLARTEAQINTGTAGLFAGHLETTNYVFADGHAKALRPLATVAANANPPLGNMWLWAAPSTSAGKPQPDLYKDTSNSLATSNAWYRTQLGYSENYWSGR